MPLTKSLSGSKSVAKLSEIEALIYTREDLQHDEEPVYLKQDVDLLIRAVRQLGAVSPVSLDKAGNGMYWNGEAWATLDPDVLELLEGE